MTTSLVDMDLSYLDKRSEFIYRNELDEEALLPRYLPQGWERLTTNERRAAEYNICQDCGHAHEISISKERCARCGSFNIKRAVLPLDMVASNTLVRLGLEHVTGRKTLKAYEFIVNCAIKNAQAKKPEKGLAPYHAILSYSTIAKHVKCSRRQAIYLVRRLESVGLIRKKVRETGKIGFPYKEHNLCNIYFLGPRVWRIMKKYAIQLVSLGSFKRWKLSQSQLTLVNGTIKRLTGAKEGKAYKLLQKALQLKWQNDNGGWPKTDPPPQALFWQLRKA